MRVFDPWELSQDLRSDFAYASQTTMLYVKIGEIVASKILFARNGGSLLKSDEAGWTGSYYKLIATFRRTIPHIDDWLGKN